MKETQPHQKGSQATENSVLQYAEGVNRVLFTIADAVNTTPDLGDLYATIHRSLGSIIDVTNFFIAIVDAHKKTLYFPYYVDTTDDDFSPINNFDTESSLTGLVVLKRKPLLLREEELQKRAEKEGIWGPVPRIWMGVPLIIREEVIGVMVVQSYTDPDRYTTSDLELLSAISHQTAIAIDRKRSLDTLKESEERAAFALRATGSGVWELNIQTNELFFDDNHYLIAGYEPGEYPAVPEEWQKRVHPGDLPRVIELLDLCRRGETEIYRSEYRYRRKNGKWMWILSHGRIFEKDADNNPIRFAGTHTDITLQKSAEEQLKISEETYRNIFLNAQIGLFKVQLSDGKLIECNDSLARMLGYDDRLDCLSHFSTEYILPSSKIYRRAIRRLLRYGELRNEETPFRQKDGSAGWYRYSLKFFKEEDYVQGIVEDITEIRRARREKKQLQDKLNRSKKMEALGLLAGGVAHDLNNILSGIISYPELLLLKLEEDSELVPPLKAIMDSGNRAATVVNDLLAIARSAASKKETHSVQQLVTDYLHSPECKQFEEIYPNLVIDSQDLCYSPNIFCSSVHVKKCIMNLVTNGIEAISGNGKVSILTENIPPYHDTRRGGPPESVVLSVNDSGPGISSTDIEHIFEPFYTKKMMGKSGTGLGLTVVWNTMEDHDGEVRVESDSEGTTFKLIFPATAAQKDSVPASFNINEYMGDGESILIVDDEEQLRDIASKILISLGYAPIEVESGEAAVRLLQERSVDLVILDMLMEPGMNGRETYEEIVKINPYQKAIIASGYSESSDVETARKLGVGAFVKKPYSVQQLCVAVKQELDK